MLKMQKITHVANELPFIAWRVLVVACLVALTYRVLAWGFGW